MPKPPITENSGFTFGRRIDPIQRWYIRDRKDMPHREDGPAVVAAWRRSASLEWYHYGRRLCYVRVLSGNRPVKEGC